MWPPLMPEPSASPSPSSTTATPDPSTTGESRPEPSTDPSPEPSPTVTVTVTETAQPTVPESVQLDPAQFTGITTGLVLILCLVAAILIAQMRRP